MFKPLSFSQLHALGFQSLCFPLLLNTLSLELRVVKDRTKSLLNLSCGGAPAAGLLATAKVADGGNIVVADGLRVPIVQTTLER